jgi:hypothetical protein
VYLISDMARPAWGVADDSPGGTAGALTAAITDRARLNILPCGGDTPPNVAITRFVSRERLVARHTPIRLEADVVNFGEPRTQSAQLHVLRGERIVRRVPLPDIGPGGRETVAFSIGPGDPGDQPLEVRLPEIGEDALNEDNRRFLALHVSRDVPVLIVEGRAVGAWGQAEGDAGYLAVALAPRVDPREATRLAPTRVSAERLADEPLDEYRMMVLCNVERLPQAAWTRIEAYVYEGGGLLITAGDALDLVNYNTWGYRDGAGVMPARVRAPLDGGEMVGGDMVGGETADGSVRFVASDDENAVMGDFEHMPSSGLFRARVTRRLLADVDDPAAEVLARYSDGSAALVARAFGQGRVALLTTSADMSWTNLPAKGDFVSLAQKLAEYLSRPATGAVNLECGHDYERFLAPEEALPPPRVTLPDGTSSPADVRRVDERTKLVFRDVEAAGFYRVGSGGSVGVVGSEGLFAANVPPEESDPACLAEREIAAVFDGEFVYGRDDRSLARMASGGATAEWAGTLIHLALLCLVCETWAAMRFGAHRR